ncbi:dienelactone hydrolase family protein [Mesobaculum littorinae]|uniref:Dienelactone hydrolase family protein n=1 Tax=Mesobaculum littorinae TaxID=2486419 RepID=A0A438AFL3_9RHOB|nr:dienelactone hydrolase family protein [Mesobaculum littorinae]RVV97496.1 dienelactone hydrolase family protein [Mesobaculum littorinae]
MLRTTLTALPILALAAPALAEDVSYSYEDTDLTGYYAAADDPKGLVLIASDWDGLTDYERERADMLAEMGYDAFALDMFGPDVPLDTMEERQAATGALYEDRERMRGLTEAGLAAARDKSDAATLIVAGYCFGGGVALEMARSEMAGEAAGYATFHGTLATPEGQGWDGDEPPVLVLHGAADTAVPLADAVALTEELEAAGNDFTVEIYSGAPHAFTVMGSDSYQERADKESWEAFTDFLEEQIGA